MKRNRPMILKDSTSFYSLYILSFSKVVICQSIVIGYNIVQLCDNQSVIVFFNK